jgi:hypothetical protein
MHRRNFVTKLTQVIASFGAILLLGQRVSESVPNKPDSHFRSDTKLRRSTGTVSNCEISRQIVERIRAQPPEDYQSQLVEK